MLKLYRSSVSKLLTSVYPEYPHTLSYSLDGYKWDYSKFRHVPKGYWDNITNQRSKMEELSFKLNITHLDDWYQVKVDEFLHVGGSALFQCYGSMSKLLQSIYPEYLFMLCALTRLI